jgi:hypothetical protein
MALTREERKLLHQKFKQPTFGSGKPDSKEGYDGDIAFRQVEGSGTVQYVKEHGDWTAVASSGEMPAVRVVGGGTGGGGVSDHGSLSGLTDDDHTQYLLVNGTRIMTGNLTIGADSDGSDRTITFGHTTLKTIVGIDDSADAFIINTDDAFDATLANNSLSIDASHNVIIAGGVTSGSSGYTVGTTVITDDSIVMTPSTSDTITIAATTNGVLNITTVDAAAAAANIQITADGTAELAGTTVTLDSSGDIALSADGDQITMDDGTTTRFVFNVDSTPEIDVTGAFTIDGSSTITLDAVSNFIAKTNGRDGLKIDTSNHAYFHAYSQTLFNDYYININATNRHLTSGSADFQQNYSWLGKHSVSSAYNTSFGT